MNARQYAVARALLGLYLAVHLAALVPWGAELFSREGVLPSLTLNPLGPLFPNVLGLVDTPAGVTVVLLAGVVLAAALTLGLADRLAALALWYVWACLLGRNPLILNPSIPYVGWLLLLHAAAGPPRRADPSWRLAPQVQEVAWAVLALGYTYSAATKLCSPSWVDGTALWHVIAGPLSRPTPLRDALLSLPAPAFAAMTWGALALELACAPLGLARRLRPWLWLALVGMHLGILVLIDFADLTVGMLVAHAFTFDPAWLPSWARELRPRDLVRAAPSGAAAQESAPAWAS